MFVNCFTLKIEVKSNISLEELSKIFGKNIPNYSVLEGGDWGYIYNLFCVDAKIDLKEICKKYNCKIFGLENIQIDENTYNNKYTIHENFPLMEEKCRYYLELN